ncbi:MAG: branched-chain amino acid ABC transporter permease [Ancalomicrobiaceae bacterium]|nr:branched-chain amino acid ABC transporter permease [Ancalomicrobiaceae bacterium]
MQFLVSGVAIGSIYGLIGMALAITFYVTRIINFAEGQLMMVTAMVTAELFASGWPTWAAAGVGLACSCIIGLLSYLIAVRPILAANRLGFGWLVSTLGFAVIVENAAAYIWGPTSQAFPPMLRDVSLHVFDAVLTGQQLLAIVTAAVLTLGFELVRRNTLFGKLGMATATDPEMASAIGINTTLVALVAFAVSALFAGIAGLLIGPSTFANPYLGHTFGTYGFIAMMIGGGTEKPISAMFGGLLLGICAEGANAMINSQASDWFPFAVLAVILLISPKGLFNAGALLRPGRILRRSGENTRSAG